MKRGLLIVNTGSPTSPHRKDVRAFVEAMLSDPLVMTVPDWFRPILVKWIIGPFRQFASARKYSLIWDNEQNQSPILYSAKALAKALEKEIDITSEVGMTYLEPSILGALNKLKERNSELEELLVFPLFPQFAESSYLAAVEKVKLENNKIEKPFQLRIVEPYFNHPEYIKAITESIKAYLTEDNYEHVIFNFHSLPLSHVEKGFSQGKEFDYVYQTKETVRLVQHELNLAVNDIRLVYSSAFGKKWLEPSLLDQVKELAISGVKKILVVSPGFAADNLETLFDIDIESREMFMKHGGTKFTYVPCLNHQQHWISAVQQIII